MTPQPLDPKAKTKRDNLLAALIIEKWLLGVATGFLVGIGGTSVGWKGWPGFVVLGTIIIIGILLLWKWHNNLLEEAKKL